MLPHADIHVFTNHKNLGFNNLKIQHVLCWRMKIEEFSPMLHYIKDPHNILANNLSRLQCLDTLAQIVEGKKLVEPAEVSNEEEDKGSTKCTLCGIVLFKLDTSFSMCFAC
jgi:hypothetical protein